jgi:hypothetical protein
VALKDKKEIIIKVLENLFGKEHNITFYFLKKGRNLSDYETIIPYKTRKDVDPNIIRKLQKTLQKKTGESSLELIRWSQVIGKIIPASKVFKIPFFDSVDSETKSHPWRICPIGEHWVKRHPKHLVSGKVTDHDGHCRKNKKAKSEFYNADELNLIAETYFKTLEFDPEALPIPDALDFPNGNDYDLLIAGWTKFWNEVLKPEDPLTPDLVKVLIATESGFKLPKDHESKDGTTRGLIQITEGTRKILQNIKGELKNHHIELTIDESRGPVLNIAAGIRWLHYKKSFLERSKKRKATWEEAIFEYKGITKDIGKDETTDDIVKKVKEYNRRLKAKRK